MRHYSSVYKCSSSSYILQSSDPLFVAAVHTTTLFSFTFNLISNRIDAFLHLEALSTRLPLLGVICYLGLPVYFKVIADQRATSTTLVMDKEWRKEEGGMKMKKKIESRMKEEDNGIKVKREFGVKADERAVLVPKEKVENKKKGKVDDHKSEKKDEAKMKEAMAMKMKEKIEDRIKSKVEIPMTEAIGYKMKDGRFENKIQEKIGTNSKVEDGIKMKGEVGMDVTAKSGIILKQHLGFEENEKGDDKFKDKFEIKTKQEVSNKVKGGLGVRIKEEIVNKMQRAIGTKAKGLDMSTVEKTGRNTRTDVKEEVEDKMEVKSGIEMIEKVGAGINEKAREIVQKDIGVSRKGDDRIKIKGNIENKIITKDSNKEIVDNVKAQSGYEKRKDNELAFKDKDSYRRVEDGNKTKGDIQNKINKEIIGNVKARSELQRERESGPDSGDKIRGLVQKDVGIRQKDEDGIKMKGDFENKIITKDTRKGIVDNLKAQSGLEKKRDNGQEPKEKSGSIVQKDVGTYRKGEDENKTKGDIQNKILSRDINEETVGNVKVFSELEIEEEKTRGTMQKDSGILRKNEAVIKMKGDIEDRTITKDVNKEFVGNVMVKSEFKKKNENGQAFNQTLGSIVQEDVGAPRKREDGIKIKEDISNKIISGNANKEFEDIVNEHSEFKFRKENGHILKSKVSGMIQKNVGTHRKGEEGIKVTGDVENSTRRGGNKEVSDNAKMHSAFEKKKEISHDSKENIKDLKHKDISTHRKGEDGTKMKGNNQNKMRTRDANREILENVKIQSSPENKRETRHDLKEKVKSVMQKDVGTHRKDEGGIKMKGHMENKVITKDVNVHSKFEKKKENGHGIKGKIGDTLQKDFATHKKEDDGIRMKKDPKSKVGNENRTVGDERKGKFDENSRFLMMERLEYNIKREAEPMSKSEKQNERKDVLDEKIEEKHGIKNNIKDSFGIIMEGDSGNKTKALDEKTKRSGFVENIEEKIKNELQEESKFSVKDSDGVKSTTVAEQIKMKGETKNTISKRSEIMKVPEVVHERNEKTGNKSKVLARKIEGKSGIKGKDEIKDGIKGKVSDKIKDKGRKEKFEDTMMARHVVTKEEKNGITTKEHVGVKAKETAVSIKEKEVELNKKDHGIKIKGKVEHILIQRAHSIRERDLGNKMKAKVEYKAKGEMSTKSKEKDEKHGIRMKEDVEHRTKNKVSSKKEEKVGLKMKGEAKIKKEKE